MSEMIERVARAMCAIDSCDMSCCPDDGKTCRGPLNDWQIAQARAAIEAMREPSPEMQDALTELWRSDDKDKQALHYGIAWTAYRAMIAAALGPQVDGDKSREAI